MEWLGAISSQKKGGCERRGPSREKGKKEKGYKGLDFVGSFR